jgi:2,4-dienoyl-CoA reductase-like NADH-dependent reductase (Old Yellow Enzyme family)
MWHPPDSVRHPLPAARWPTAQEAARSLWFSPLRAGRLDLRERTWVPAMVPWRATDDGIVTGEILAWYERFAIGRPGAIVVEATGVRDIPSGPLLRIGDDRFIPGLRDLVRTVRRASGGCTRLFIQIIDFLAVKRRPEREKYLRRFLAITNAHQAALGVHSDEAARDALVAMSDEELAAVLTPRELEALRFGYRERVTDVHLPHVRCLPAVMPRVFADAAVRAEAAGFDGVELHYAHAYTMASFLSALNTRDDGYGGGRENRIRLPLEVFRAVRAAVSGRFVVGCRYLAEEAIDGGSTLEDAVYFGVEFARSGLDYLSLSRGGKFEDAKAPQVGWAVYPYTGPSGWECMPTTLADRRGPFGRNVAAAARIRAAVRAEGFETPVIVSGGIHDFEQAEGILARGDADICGAARQSLADPDWFRKVRMGRGQDVRRCTFTNYCEGLDQKHKQVTCKLWDRVEVDGPNVMRSSDGKRRLTAPLFDFDCEASMAHESEAQ